MTSFIQPLFEAQPFSWNRRYKHTAKLIRSLEAREPNAAMLFKKGEQFVTVNSISVLLILSLIAVSDALQCYDCNSHNDSRCADDVPPDSMKRDCHELPGGSIYSFCRKIDQQVEFKVNGMPEDRRIIRSCGWEESRYMNDCYDRSGFGGAQRVCSCYGNLCNGGGQRSPTSFYIFLFSLFGVFISRKVVASS